MVIFFSLMFKITKHLEIHLISRKYICSSLKEPTYKIGLLLIFNPFWKFSNFLSKYFILLFKKPSSENLQILFFCYKMRNSSNILINFLKTYRKI